MAGVGRMMVVLGLVLVGAGLVVVLLGRWNGNLPLGRLPGDLAWRGRGWTVSFPIVTCLVLSLLVSVVLWLVGWLRR